MANELQTLLTENGFDTASAQSISAKVLELGETNTALAILNGNAQPGLAGKNIDQIEAFLADPRVKSNMAAAQEALGHLLAGNYDALTNLPDGLKTAFDEMLDKVDFDAIPEAQQLVANSPAGIPVIAQQAANAAMGRNGLTDTTIKGAIRGAIGR